MSCVLIDGRGLGDASAYRGIGTYLRNVVGGLSSLPELRISTLVTRAADCPAYAQAISIRRLAPPRWSNLEHEALLPLALWRHPADVVFSPAQDPPWRCAKPWVQTIHGVLPLLGLYPALEGERRRWQRMAPRLRRASAVIAVSRHGADTAISTLGLDPHRVHVVPHGVSPAFSPDGPTSQSGDVPYVLYVGEHGPWKGYPEAVAVAGHLAARGYPHRLKIAGRLAPWVRPEVERLVATSSAPERIELLDHVATSDLPSLYRGAAALLVTSRFESFGLMSLEAMASGTPVVAFANSATEEVVADGGVLVADGDLVAFAAALELILTNDTHRAEVSAAGVERAKAFSWQRSVAAHAEILRDAARGAGP